MLVPIEYFEFERQIKQSIIDNLATLQCKYSAFELMDALTYHDRKEFDLIVDKAQNTCISLHIPLSCHFRTVYIAQSDGLRRDYRLSRFACYLIVVNADSDYEAVARAQVLLLMKKNEIL